MKKIIISVAVMSMVAGLITGPGYYLYCIFFSGQQVGKFLISERASTWHLPGGIAMSFGGTGGYKPFSVDLEPQMNPVRLNWHALVNDDAFVIKTIKENRYIASLYLDQQRLLRESIHISRRDKVGAKGEGEKDEWQSIGTLNVPRAGQYHFVLEESTKPALRVSGFEIEVRRNVILPDMKIVWSGTALLVVAFISIFVALIRHFKKIERSTNIENQKITGSTRDDERFSMEMNAAKAEKIFRDFGSTLNAAKKAGVFIADERDLPHPKRLIKEAILYALRVTKQSEMREELKSAYLSLAGWQPGIGEAKVMTLFMLWKTIFLQRDGVKTLTSASEAERKTLQSELLQSGL